VFPSSCPSRYGRLHTSGVVIASLKVDYCLVYSEHRQRSVGLPRGCSAAGVSTAGGECSSSDGDILDVEEEGIRDHGPGTVFAYACVRVRVYVYEVGVCDGDSGIECMACHWF